MKPAFILGAVLAALASWQESEPKSAADLDKQTKETLQKEISLAGIGGQTLPYLFFMFEAFHKADIECYVDPVAIPKMDEVKLSFEGAAPLDEVLEKSLKAKSLLHHVWQGIVVISDEKGRKAFQDTDWTGLTQKALSEHAALKKKLETPFVFKWNAFEPQEALKAFAKTSGVSINTDALAGMQIKTDEKRGMLSPSRTTLLGALVCLARTTGITYEISKAGGLIAKPPPKK